MALDVVTANIRRGAHVLLKDVERLMVRIARVFAVRIRHFVQDLTGQLNVVVCELANLCIINTQDFGFLASTERETGDQIHDEEDEAGSTERVGTSGDRISELVAELDPVVVEPATRDLGEAIKMCYIVSSEESCKNVADETTNGVFSENIKSIIDTEDEFELGCVVSSCGTDNTIDNCRPGRDEAGPWRDSNKAGNDTGAETNSGPFALKTIIKDTPCDTSNAGSQVSNNSGHDSAHVGGKSRTSVESEPTNPEEDGSDDNVCHVVGAVVQLVGAVPSALAQHDGVCKSSRSGRNVHWGSTGKVKSTHLVDPSR